MKKLPTTVRGCFECLYRDRMPYPSGTDCIHHNGGMDIREYYGNGGIHPDCPLENIVKKECSNESCDDPTMYNKEKYLEAKLKYYYNLVDRIAHAVDLPGSPSPNKCVNRAIELLNKGIQYEEYYE